jgi:hypothetical protein
MDVTRFIPWGASAEYGVRRKLAGGNGHPITGLDRPLGIQKFDDSKFSSQSANKGGKVSSRTYWPLLPPPQDALPVLSSVIC